MAEVIDKEDLPRPAPDTPVQYVRAVDLEARLNKIVLQLEAQNKAWQKCLIILTEMNTILFEKYKSQERLLEEHPPVKGPAPAPVTSAGPSQPFNNYTDSIPYGTELEEERVGPTQSFPPPSQTDIPESPPAYGSEPHGDYNDDAVPESAAPKSAESATQQPRMRISPGPPVASKAELLERVEKET